jgi:hypothetical protein
VLKIYEFFNSTVTKVDAFIPHWKLIHRRLDYLFTYCRKPIITKRTHVALLNHFYTIVPILIAAPLSMPRRP